MQLSKDNRLIYVWYGCNALILLTLFFCINTSIELRDEGYYLQGYLRNQPIFFNHSGFHFIVRLLPYSDDIFMARLYRIILHLAAGTTLAWSIHKYVLKHIPFSHLAAYAVLGNFLSYLFSPLSISYNSLNLIFLQLLFAVYLSFRAISFSTSKRLYIPLLVFGVLLGMQAYNKLTSAAFVTMMICADQLLLRYTKKIQLLSIVAIIGVVSLITFIGWIYFTFGKNFLTGLQLGNKSYSPFDDGHNSLSFILKQLLVNPVVDARFLFLYTLAFAAVYYFSLKLDKQQSLFTHAGYFLILSAVFYQFRNVHLGLFTGAEYIVSFALFVIIAFLVQRAQLSNGDYFNYHFAFALFLMPFAGFFGSDNPPLLGLSHYTLFYLLLIIYINQWLKITFVSYVFPVMISGFLLYHIIYDPYSNPSVFKQRNSTIICGKRICVSDFVFEQIKSFEQIRPSISAQKPLIPVAVSNGILYVNDLRSFYTIQYNNIFLTLGYIQLLLDNDLPGDAQILINKHEFYEFTKPKIQQLLSKASASGLNAELVKETDQYQLYQLSQK
jgi:hypothetical protein